MEPTGTMTLKTALRETLGILQGVSVPMGLMQPIGLPVLRAMENLEHIIGEIKDQPAETDAEKAAEERALREEDL